MLTDMLGVPLDVGDKVLVKTPTSKNYSKFTQAEVLHTGDANDDRPLIRSLYGDCMRVKVSKIIADVGNPTLSDNVKLGSYVVSKKNLINEVSKVTKIDNTTKNAEAIAIQGHYVLVNIDFTYSVDSYIEYIKENYPELMI